MEYATEHGVFVAVAASNDGHSASVQDKGFGINNGTYEPINSGTFDDPGVAKNATTVAAENSRTDEGSGLADFTSWGPLPDYTLKPDVAAPGVDVISTVNGKDGYFRSDGTSMATPFTFGVAALVIERLKRTNPELKGAALVQPVKGLIMNTATPSNGWRCNCLTKTSRCRWDKCWCSNFFTSLHYNWRWH
ncbi:hypothetical protein EJK17_01045 [Lactobacillus xujianguonis]|uniref:Peptidase S8/S53 domain-containing protein n=1 Tax=Lactobacillus xujianguonis TaxID=2495899 RepID=A0A437SXE8_9LACO|nr:hypothetical protein EJK17_01045 [Lactobacillus xujianguonis]RVU77756.1 hypothetical protein EJK20_00665 [Lactobacillus xujianguonis]